MNYIIITDHEENNVCFGSKSAMHSVPHSQQSEVNFVETEFQVYYATALLSLSFPNYKIKKFSLKNPLELSL